MRAVLRHLRQGLELKQRVRLARLGLNLEKLPLGQRLGFLADDLVKVELRRSERQDAGCDRFVKRPMSSLCSTTVRATLLSPLTSSNAASNENGSVIPQKRSS